MSFRVCRGCFAHECIANLTSLFEGDSKNTEKLSVFGIDVSFFLKTF